MRSLAHWQKAPGVKARNGTDEERRQAHADERSAVVIARSVAVRAERTGEGDRPEA
ncbi:MAG: hypothetical protein PHX26_11925 [Proteiniphilum sp.]|nr:hypothetical protein [Proteiniphilum sp.]